MKAPNMHLPLPFGLHAAEFDNPLNEYVVMNITIYL